MKEPLQPLSRSSSNSNNSFKQIKEIEEILPHRAPFLFLSRIIAINKGKSAVAEFDIPLDHPFFKGHFPQEPIFPGVIILEFLAQTGALAVLSQPDLKGKVVYLAGIESARFKTPAKPGNTIRAEITIESFRLRIGKAFGKAFVGEKEIASAKVLFALPV